MRSADFYDPGEGLMDLLVGKTVSKEITREGGGGSECPAPGAE